MDHAFVDARLDSMSRKPIVEMLIPSTPDTTLAPQGAHVASLYCQHFSYKLPAGWNWRQEKQRAIDLIFSTVESHAPIFRASVVGHSALSPLDLEETLGLAGGEIFHGVLGLDQLWAVRPMLGHGDYRTPLKSLYLCGSGAHPGGGVTGIPGHMQRERSCAMVLVLIADQLTKLLLSPQADTKQISVANNARICCSCARLIVSTFTQIAVDAS